MDREKTELRAKRVSASLLAASILFLLAHRFKIALPYIPPPDGILSKATTLHIPYYQEKVFYLAFFAAFFVVSAALLPLLKSFAPIPLLLSSAVFLLFSLSPLKLLSPVAGALFYFFTLKIGSLVPRDKWKWVNRGAALLTLAYKEFFVLFNLLAVLLRGVGLWFLISFPSSGGITLLLYLAAYYPFETAQVVVYLARHRKFLNNFNMLAYYSTHSLVSPLAKIDETYWSTSVAHISQ